ncbi:DsbA family protein [Arcanobacterium phocae]|uniref:DsbA family protein n=1 Tax=Arcanobacterium phocae TaxID=131112 RepID=UPI001C0F2A7D|nr:thioredoxin domain-containing protein [Arcanobacterium phocae]
MASKNTPGMSNERLTKEERRQVAREKARLLQEMEAKRAKRNKIVTIVVAVLALVLVSFAIWQIVSKDPGQAKELGSYSGSVREVKADNVSDDGGVLFDQSGSATATESGKPVIGLWSDYMCPGCEHFEGNYGKLMADHSAAGDLQFKFYRVNTLGTDFSTKGATAFYYVAQYAPEKLWAFNKALMDYGMKIHAQSVGPNPSASDIADIAKSVGVPDDVVNDLPASIVDEKWQGLVAKTVEKFRANEYTGTPTLTVNGKADDSWTKGNPDEVVPQILNNAAGK